MRSHWLWTGLCAVLLALGCAESRGAAPEDDDDDLDDAGSDSDTDSDSDADTDSDTDVDTDECGCSDPVQACCQDDGCTLEPEGTVCDETYDAEYSCQSEDPECGSILYARFKQRFCDGVSPTCAGEVSEDFGEWQEHEPCEFYERCSDGDAGVGCVEDLEHCPIGFGQRICFEGGQMADCAEEGCPDPLPSLVLSKAFFNVADGGAGEAVLLEVEASARQGATDFDWDTMEWGYVHARPFTDIHAAVKHGDREYSFYNNYASDEVESGTQFEWRFHKEWLLTDFWGEAMAGTWELSFEDSAYSGIESDFGGPEPFDLTEWCLTFLIPDETEIDAEPQKEWKVEYPAPSAYDANEPARGTIVQGKSFFEGQIEDIYKFGSEAPVLRLEIKHKSPQAMSIKYVVADGQIITIKEMGTAEIPASVELPELAGKWATGRYQLLIESTDANGAAPDQINYVKSISLSVGVPDDMDAGVDAGTDAG